MSDLLSFDALLSFVSLTFLEVVLSVDNLVFVALAAGRLPPERRAVGRGLGLVLALVLRLLLLCGLVWVARLERPLFALAGRPVSAKDLVLVLGGLFLLYKGSTEIHAVIEARGASDDPVPPPPPRRVSTAAVVVEIGVLNIVFSLDSVITAIGIARQLAVMAAAVAAASLLMLLAAGRVGDFLDRRPTARMLGLAFILLVGAVLIADGTGLEVPRGYLYFAILFSLAVEVLNTVRPPKKKGRL